MSPITEKSIGLDGEVFADRRGKPRQKCLRGAVASFNKGSSVFECVARNVSDSGARLSFGETFALPAEFDLVIAPDPQKRHARVAWRTMTMVGVTYA